LRAVPVRRHRFRRARRAHARVARPVPDLNDDAPRAAALARALGTRHVEVAFDEDDFWRLLPAACSSVDDPTADYAILPMLKLAERAARDVKVVLCGEGGDEVFAGYRRYREPAWKRWLRRRRGRPGIACAGPEAASPATTRCWTALQRMQADDLFGWLPADLLTKLDRTLIGHGLEGRVPYLDERCAAFAFSLEDGLKVREGFGKALLRDWFAARQQAVSAWERKQGFTVPIRPWLSARRVPLAAFLAGHEGVRATVPPALLARALAPRPFDTRVAELNYRLLCFALWYDAIVCGRAATAELFAPRAPGGLAYAGPV
jgi:asparagine synthase (glutamine-hydrolysing)